MNPSFSSVGSRSGHLVKRVKISLIILVDRLINQWWYQARINKGHRVVENHEPTKTRVAALPLIWKRQIFRNSQKTGTVRERNIRNIRKRPESYLPQYFSTSESPLFLASILPGVNRTDTVASLRNNRVLCRNIPKHFSDSAAIFLKLTCRESI